MGRISMMLAILIIYILNKKRLPAVFVTLIARARERVKTTICEKDKDKQVLNCHGNI